ncbi:MAG: isocitrate lyase/PEP mutase family protein [Chloroflexi bacterium]|nr:isocitrate lyase/PEP mutase family protein [Chloroflexota bacterium]
MCLMRKTTRLRELFKGPKIFVLAGTANALEGKLVEQTGFEGCYMSGSGTASYLCGLPDAGLTTMTEIVMNAGYIASAISIPLVSDSDTGYGNAINVRRTVQEFIRAGVAGIHIEDQVSPKRCGFVVGKQVLPIEEAAGKYRAAVDARNELDPDFIIIARTDSRGAVGGSFEEAITRAKAYRKAGADVAYLEALQSLEEVKVAIEQVGPPIMFTLGAIPLEEQPTHAQMEKMGISCAFHPGLARLGAGGPTWRLLWEFLHDFKQRDILALRDWMRWEEKFPWKFGAPPHRFDVVGFPQVREWEEKYLPPEDMEKYQKSIGNYVPGGSQQSHMAP